MTFREYMGDPIEKLNRNHITRTIYMMYVTTILMVIISTVITYGIEYIMTPFFIALQFLTRLKIVNQTEWSVETLVNLL